MKIYKIHNTLKWSMVNAEFQRLQMDTALFLQNIRMFTMLLKHIQDAFPNNITSVRRRDVPLKIIPQCVKINKHV